MSEVTGWPAVVGPAVYVYPAGVGRSWNAGTCCGPAQLAGINDVSFLTTVVNRVLTANADAAPDKVYLVGYSNGGRMAWRMACATPHLFTAVASVEAVPVYPCAQAASIPLIEVASTGDPLLTISPSQPAKTVDGRVQLAVDTAMSTWRSLMQCSPTPTRVVQGSLVTTTWGNCAGASRVALALYPGGTHAWPGGDAVTPSAANAIWSFFTGAGKK
jgi:polyhydroxybutyrate depolymerase